MISHDVVTAGLWLLTAIGSGTAGLFYAHWWWPSKKLLDEEYDDGYDRGWEDRGGQVRQDTLPERAIGEDRAGEYLAGGQEHAAEDGTTGVLLPGMPGLAPDQPPLGSIPYPELFALGSQETVDELAAAEAAIDPDWHPKLLARSEAWLAGCRAELGLVAA